MYPREKNVCCSSGGYINVPTNPDACTCTNMYFRSLFNLMVMQMESRMGYDHYVGGDSESDEIRKGDEFVVVCGYGRIGRLVCELLGKKFIRFVAFDNNPLKAMEERKR